MLILKGANYMYSMKLYLYIFQENRFLVANVVSKPVLIIELCNMQA